MIARFGFYHSRRMIKFRKKKETEKKDFFNIKTILKNKK
jgi:hypothetical protein